MNRCDHQHHPRPAPQVQDHEAPCHEGQRAAADGRQQDRTVLSSGQDDLDDGCRHVPEPLWDLIRDLILRARSSWRPSTVRPFSITADAASAAAAPMPVLLALSASFSLRFERAVGPAQAHDLPSGGCMFRQPAGDLPRRCTAVRLYCHSNMQQQQCSMPMGFSRSPLCDF